MSISGYATPAVGKPLEKFEYVPEELDLFDVEVKITHCGVCHSDLHLVNNDWGISTYRSNAR